MNEKDLYTMLQGLNIPVAYDHFVITQTPPFLVYRATAPSQFKADSKNYYTSKNFEIELVTETKDIELEESVEALLEDIPYDKTDEIWDEDEKIYHIFYEL